MTMGLLEDFHRQQAARRERQLFLTQMAAALVPLILLAGVCVAILMREAHLV